MTLAKNMHTTDQLLQGQRVVLSLLAQGASLRKTLSSIAHYAEVCTPDMQASIMWFEVSTGKLRRGGHARLPDAFADAVDGLVPGPAAGSCGTAAFQRSRVVSFDVNTDPLWAAFREFAAQHNIRSAWSTPLLSPADGSLLGVFGMYYPDTRNPSEEDLALVDHFTNLAAIAIERSRYDEALRESERRRHHGLLALTAGMAHELNTPLGVARTASQLLGEELMQAPDADRFTDTLALVQDNLERGLRLLRSFHASVIDQAKLDVETTDVMELVVKTVKSLGPLLLNAKLTVNVNSTYPGARLVRCATVRLVQVVTNLITNAAIHAYGPEGGTLDITIGGSVLNSNWTELLFVDHGVGMSESVAAHCADPFFTTARGTSSGLGLFVARHVTESELGGSLLLETHPGAGVRWTLLLPMAS